MAMKRFYAARINVIRIGLQSSDLIDFDSEVEAGPFHPAFGEWVMSFLFFDAIKRHLEDAPQGEILEIQCHPKKISVLIGDKRQNIQRIQHLAVSKGYKRVFANQNANLNEMTLRIVIDSVSSEIDIINE
jgi:TusA-related sulfurtransferase